MSRKLGLDIGDRRIGVALSDPGGILASPLTIIERKNEASDIAAITALVRQHEVSVVIAGLPRCMDGSIGHQAKRVQSFVDKLAAQLDVPVEFQDERLSTHTAQQFMKEAAGKKRLTRKPDDAIAAAVILQGYLDEGR